MDHFVELRNVVEPRIQMELLLTPFEVDSKAERKPIRRQSGDALLR